MSKEIISSFSGQNRWLSNFYTCNILYENILYPSVEHAFQAQKFLNIFNKTHISKISYAGDTKREGKLAKPLPGCWEVVKVSIMKELLLLKFRDTNLTDKLLNTEKATLIEGNRHGDTFWGICGGEGLNILGKLLMEVRDEIKYD